MMANSITEVSKPGKLILLGEYAVLERAPCLVAAVDKKCNVKIEPHEKDFFKIEASNPDIPDIEFTVDEDMCVFTNKQSRRDKKKLRFVYAALNNYFSNGGQSIEPFKIKIDTTSFYHEKSRQKLGLGASAAITVSLLSALRSYIGRPIAGLQLFQKAYPIHRKAQGNLGSGADIAAASLGGVIQYRMPEYINDNPEQIEPLVWSKDLEIIPVWTGKSASTQGLIERIRGYRKEKPKAYMRIMKPMVQLSIEGCRAFKAANIDALTDIISDFVRLEYKLGKASHTDIVSDAHLKIKETVERSGGVYKPSGAGSGDMGVAFCNGKENYLRVGHALKKSSFDVINLSLQTSIE